MHVTDDYSARLIRLPLWVGMGDDVPQTVVDTLTEVLAAATST
jgi:dTDP-4-amino-4,6-dideoxygalactose transaminase